MIEGLPTNDDRFVVEDPSTVVKENFDVEKVLQQFLDDIDEKLKTMSITLETAHELRKFYRTYINGNTIVSFTTDRFIQMTVVEWISILWKIFAKDYYVGQDLNRIRLETLTAVDSLALALKRALGGKERSLMLESLDIRSRPGSENQENRKIL